MLAGCESERAGKQFASEELPAGQSLSGMALVVSTQDPPPIKTSDFSQAITYR